MTQHASLHVVKVYHISRYVIRVAWTVPVVKNQHRYVIFVIHHICYTIIYVIRNVHRILYLSIISHVWVVPKNLGIFVPLVILANVSHVQMVNWSQANVCLVNKVIIPKIINVLNVLQRVNHAKIKHFVMNVHLNITNSKIIV